jgi:lipoyl-dependent peroxiredoxin
MPTRSSRAQWSGDLKGGHGTMTVGNDAWEGPYSFRSRFEEGEGTNPEELLAAAHAGCFSMALSNILAQAGHPPEAVRTRADVHLEVGEGGAHIPRVDLHLEAEVPGISEDEFLEHAEAAKKGCPVSKLFNADINLDAKLA